MNLKFDIFKIIKSYKWFIFIIVIFLFGLVLFFIQGDKLDKEQTERINKNEYTVLNKNAEDQIFKEDNIDTTEKESVSKKISKEKVVPPKKKTEDTKSKKIKKEDKLKSTKNIKSSGTDRVKTIKPISFNPDDTVKELHKGLRDISLNNLNGYKNVLKLIQNTYDTNKMTGMIVGNLWKNVPSDKQNEMKLVFEEYIAKNYIKRFRKMKNVDFKELETTKINQNYTMVKTILKIENKENIKIDYLLLKKQSGWKIFDILLAGSVSEIATKKSEFGSFTKGKTIDKLIEALRNKNLTILE